MTTTATALRLSSGAVVAPSYERQHSMFSNDKDAAEIVAKIAPDEPKTEPEDGAEVSEGLLAAAEDIMDCVQGGYSSPAPGDNASRVEVDNYHEIKRAKAKVFARALGAFLDMYGRE